MNTIESKYTGPGTARTRLTREFEPSRRKLLKLAVVSVGAIALAATPIGANATSVLQAPARIDAAKLFDDATFDNDTFGD